MPRKKVRKDQPKEYHLSKEDRETLEKQNELRSQHEYVAQLIRRDMYVFVNKVLREQFGIEQGVELQYDMRRGVIIALSNPQDEETSEGSKVSEEAKE